MHTSKAADPQKEPQLRTVTIAEREDSTSLRTPSLAMTKEGTLLAFWQLRKGGESGGDFPEEADNVVCRSTDGGATWSEPQTILSHPKVDYHGGPVVVDRITGAIFKFARSHDGTAKAGEGWRDNFVLRSDDDGKTWMRQVLNVTNERAEKRFGPGNGGHGIQLSDGTLIVHGGYWREKSLSLCLIESRDHGVNWQLTPNSDADYAHVEFSIAETAPGKVYLNIREKGRPERPFTVIEPGRTPIAALEPTVGLPASRTHAGMTKRGEGDEARLYLSAPTGGSGQWLERRRGLTLFRSDMEGRVFEMVLMLEPMVSGYSDLVVLPNGDLGCLYESGKRAPGFEMRFVRVPQSML